MSAHRALNDLYRAFESKGPGILDDPGNGGTITFSGWGQICPITTTTTETATLAQPNRAGLIGTVELDVDGGDLTLTVTGGYNQDADTVITFADAGDFVTFISIKVGTSYYWRVLGQERKLAVPSSSPSASPSSSPSATPSTSPSSSPSSSPSAT